MMVVVVIAVVWLALALLIGVLVGGAARLADEEDRPSDVPWSGSRTKRWT